MIYFTSDLHINHDKDFIYKVRGFNTVTAMNEAIIESHNKIVTDDDIVYSLGDELMGDPAVGLSYLAQMKGKFKFIRGNHTTNNKVKLLEEIGWECLGWAHMLKEKTQHYFLCHYASMCGNYDSSKPLKARVLNLCGHIHTEDRFCDWDKGLIYHVDWDAHHGPVSLDNIIKEVKEKLDYEHS